MISLSCLAYFTSYYGKLLLLSFLFKCEIKPLLPVAYQFSRDLKGSTVSDGV